MPINLTPNVGNFPEQSAPIAGEARTAGSISTPFQNAADRTQFLKDRVDFLDPTGTGVRRLRTVLNTAALKAVTSLADEAVILVDGQGLYLYDAASVLAEVAPLIITPTSVGAGAGRWILSHYLTLDVANGVPRLDGNARVATTKLAASEGGAKILSKNVGYGLVDMFAASGAGPFQTTSTSYVDVGTIAATFVLEVGDRVVLTGQAYGYQVDLTLANHFTRVAVVNPAASTLLVGASEILTKTSALNELVGLPIGTVFTASTAGSHTFKLQQRSEAASGGATVGVANLNLCAQVFRP